MLIVQSTPAGRSLSGRPPISSIGRSGDEASPFIVFCFLNHSSASRAWRSSALKHQPQRLSTTTARISHTSPSTESSNASTSSSGMVSPRGRSTARRGCSSWCLGLRAHLFPKFFNATTVYYCNSFIHTGIDGARIEKWSAQKSWFSFLFLLF
jgi:hypothetical protein